MVINRVVNINTSSVPNEKPKRANRELSLPVSGFNVKGEVAIREWSGLVHS